QIEDGNDLQVGIELVRLRARVNDQKLREPEIISGDPHRLGHRGRVRQRALEAKSLSTVEHQKVELRPLVCSPEVSVTGSEQGANLLDHESLPGCASFG